MTKRIFLYFNIFRVAAEYKKVPPLDITLSVEGTVVTDKIVAAVRCSVCPVAVNCAVPAPAFIVCPFKEKVTMFVAGKAVVPAGATEAAYWA